MKKKNIILISFIALSIIAIVYFVNIGWIIGRISYGNEIRIEIDPFNTSVTFVRVPLTYKEASDKNAKWILEIQCYELINGTQISIPKNNYWFVHTSNAKNGYIKAAITMKGEFKQFVFTLSGTDRHTKRKMKISSSSMAYYNIPDI